MSWWPFSTRFSRADASPVIALPIHLPKDLSLFAQNDACIKLWLPEKLVEGLEALSASHSMSRPDVLRWLIFEHVYGRPALERLHAWKRQKDAEEAERRRREAEQPTADICIKYSMPRAAATPERTYTAQLLGKSVGDFKLWLPSPLKSKLVGAHLKLTSCAH
jgi:hypothetical protein